MRFSWLHRMMFTIFSLDSAEIRMVLKENKAAAHGQAAVSRTNVATSVRLLIVLTLLAMQRERPLVFYMGLISVFVVLPVTAIRYILGT